MVNFVKCKNVDERILRLWIYELLGQFFKSIQFSTLDYLDYVFCVKVQQAFSRLVNQEEKESLTSIFSHLEMGLNMLLVNL